MLCKYNIAHSVKKIKLWSIFDQNMTRNPNILYISLIYKNSLFVTIIMKLPQKEMLFAIMKDYIMLYTTAN